MAVNDVMVKDENAPRNAWRLARVEEAFSSHDGLVRKVKLAIAIPIRVQQPMECTPLSTSTPSSRFRPQKCDMWIFNSAYLHDI